MSAGIKGLVIGIFFGAWFGVTAMATLMMARDGKDDE